MKENQGAALSSRHKKRLPVGISTDTISITPDGHIQQGAGVIYMTNEIVTDISLSTTQDSALTGVTPTTETAVVGTTTGSFVDGTTTASAVTNVIPTTASYVNGLITSFCEFCEEIVTGATTTTAVSSISLSNASFVDGTTTSSAVTGTTTDDFVTEISEDTDTFLTGGSVVKTTEEVLMPVVVRDAYGNFVEMVRTEDKSDYVIAEVQGSSSNVDNKPPLRRTKAFDSSRLYI